MSPRPQASVECSSSAAANPCAGAACEGFEGLRPDWVATVPTEGTSSHTSNNGPPEIACVDHHMGGRPTPEQSGGRSGLHDHGDDHRAAAGAIGHEPGRGPADVALQRLDVDRLRRRRERLVQRPPYFLLALLDETL